MKASTFENLIRKVVREEIDYSLRREIKSLKEDLSSELKPTIVEHTKIPTKTHEPLKSPPNSRREQLMGTNPIKKVQTKNFTSNGALNELLNETAMGSTNTESGNNPVSLAQPFATAAPLPMDTEGMPAEVASAITRDYSGLMKKIIDKKGK